MARRRSRRNVYWGRPRKHSKAARKGWGRRRARRSRRNAGSVLSIRHTTRSLSKGFSKKAFKQAGTILGGNILTTWSEGMISSRLPFLRSHPIAEVASLFVLASAAGVFAAKTPLRKFISPKDVMIGGFLAGITRGAKLLFPGSFTTCGLGEDMEGLGSWYVAPFGNAAHPILAGMGAYASPHAVDRALVAGMGDHAIYPQTHEPLMITALDGLAANQAMGEEIGMQM